MRGAQLVLFSVKSTDTEAAGKAMAPYLERDAAIVTLQNGVDNAERLAATLKRDVIPAVVYVAVEMAGPGHVRHHGRGELVIGRAARSDDIVLEARAQPRRRRLTACQEDHHEEEGSNDNHAQESA